jgi:hypothetical protein
MPNLQPLNSPTLRISVSLWATVSIKPTCSQFSLPPLGTPDIETMCGKQGMPSSARDRFSNFFSSVRVSPTIVPLGTHQVSAYVGFISSLRRTLETKFTKGHHTSPKDGRYLLTQRESATLTSSRKQESHLLRRPTLLRLEFRTS